VTQAAGEFLTMLIAAIAIVVVAAAIAAIALARRSKK